MDYLLEVIGADGRVKMATACPEMAPTEEERQALRRSGYRIREKGTAALPKKKEKDVWRQMTLDGMGG